MNFNINNLASSSPKFSINELRMLNKDILQLYEYSDVKQRFFDSNYKNINENFWIFVKNNINYFIESFEWIKIINNDEIYENNSKELLQVAAKLLPEEPFDENSWNIWINLIKHKTGIKGKDLFMPIRLALTGRDKGPELKYLLPLISKKHILRKLGNYE